MERSLQWSRPASLLLFAAAFLAAAAVASAGYNPDPLSVVNHFNRAVQRHASSSPRRTLSEKKKKSKYSGPCLATNPIDRCWRCRKDWATDRQRLARCAKGFGRETTGGLGGKIYIVTDPSDDYKNPVPGTLRWGVVQIEPLWIIFARDMIITTTQEIVIQSNKTIDGRGAQVHLADGGSLTIQNQRNIIIHNLHIHDIKKTEGGDVAVSPNHFTPRTKADGDGVSLFNATDVWIDHLSMSLCEDGMVDVVAASTAVTISNCHLTNHNDVMLFGANDNTPEDKVIQVSVAFNHFGRGLVQRMPRCRYGFFHVVNNDYTHWLMYAIGGSSNPTIISQGNRYIAPPNMAAKQITKRDYAEESVWKNWVWHTEADLMMNNAFFTPSGGNIQQQLNKKDLIKPKPGEYVTRLTRFAGTLACKPGIAC
ncbi:pectate lyase-like [Lolium rigidum]|uniref:pectate lyase-like n=1 Tax=Lolium rigidum TaxID=89674 RepID=UPI001F5D77FB|nr:pectate lyase-like [Lolium rigidum]